MKTILVVYDRLDLRGMGYLTKKPRADFASFEERHSKAVEVAVFFQDAPPIGRRYAWIHNHIANANHRLWRTGTRNDRYELARQIIALLARPALELSSALPAITRLELGNRMWSARERLAPSGFKLLLEDRCRA